MGKIHNNIYIYLNNIQALKKTSLKTEAQGEHVRDFYSLSVSMKCYYF